MPSRANLPPLVLVVDDDPSIRELCTVALERVGMQVICCETSMKAGKHMQLHGHRIACILADVVLGASTAMGK
jgi:DNA-binding NtrC family response regulator